MEPQRRGAVVIPLAVPYARKDFFKQKYGRQFLWNPQGKFWFWFSGQELPEDLRPFLPSATQQKPLSSEPKLGVDLVPRSC